MSRVDLTGRRGGIIGTVGLAMVLALALLVGFTAASPEAVLAAGATYSNCTQAGTSFPTDVGNVTSGSATFTFPANCTIDLTSTLTINPGVTITIEGNGLILNGQTKTFDIIAFSDLASPSTLSLDDVTAENGVNAITDAHSASTVRLVGSTLRDNSESGANRPYQVTLMDSTVSDNGYIGITADDGLTVTDSTISQNGNFGIIGLTVTVTGSTITGNSGGIFTSLGTADVANSTVSGNGVGIEAEDGSANVADSTITGNSIGISAYNASMTATILAKNSDANCALGGLDDLGYNLADDGSCGFKSVTSLPNSESTTPPTTSQLNLQPLAANGGPTETQALGSGSIAIDAVPVNDQGQCLDAAGQPITYPGTTIPITTDQRGVSRPQPSNGNCDIGAYERIQGPYTVTESTCPTQIQLQDDLDLATPGNPLTIDVTPPNCTIGLTSALTVGAGVNITIDGNGLVLDGQTKTFDIIDINGSGNPSTLALDWVTVEDGLTGINASGSAGGVYTNGGNGGTVTLTDSTVSGNAGDGVTTSGGGSGAFGFSGNGGSVTLTGSTVSGNKGNGVTTSGGYGGLYSGGNGGTVTLADSTVSGNTDDGITTSGGSGGGYGNGGNGGTVTLTDSTIGDNTSGGINLSGGGKVFGKRGAGGSFTVTATILTNTGANCVGVGSLSDNGYNLASDNSCGFTSSTSLPNGAATTPPTDQQLNLLPLGNYGGPTQTIALGPGSIAIDAIPTGTDNDQTVCLNANQQPITYPGTSTPITTDQRGITRPQGPKCDIGAYEAPAVTITTTPSAPASSGWYNSGQLGVGGKLPVTASYSGLATGELPSCSGATFTGLPTAAVTSLNQAASGSASLGDGTYSIACGVKQGTTPLGVSQNAAQPLTLKIDTTPPVITSPVSQRYTIGKAVPLTCVDPQPDGVNAVSGINSCQVTVKEPNGTTTTVAMPSDVPTNQPGTYTMTPNTVTDKAGNADTTSFTYTVGYAITALPGSTTTVNQGYYAVIRFEPTDANGHDEASRTLKVTSVELDGPNGQVIPFVYPFQYGTFSGKAGYQLELNTRNLSPGPWTLVIQIGTGASATTGTVTFTVE